MIAKGHPLAVLAARMLRTEIEAAQAPGVAHTDRRGQTIEGADLFGPTRERLGACVSARGRP